MVSYVGILEQAVKDVSDWVEKQRIPASTSSYTVKNAQINYDEKITKRNGIQPNITLTINGNKATKTSVNEPVTLEGIITLPEKVQHITLELSTMGEDDFIPVDYIQINPYQIKVSEQLSYDQTGTYFPVVRVTTQRDGSEILLSKRVSNLDRVRVVVK